MDVLLNNPSAFPPFFRGRKPRVLAGSVWAFLSSVCGSIQPASARTRAQAYLEQARDFFAAGANPTLAARPLLYYYAYMNLAKVYLLARGIPLMDFPRHGIAEASSNPYTPIYLAQALDLFDELDDKNRQQLGPLFIKTVNSNLPTGQWRIARLFESLPHVHRTLVAESGGKHLFCPVGFRVEMDAGQFRARAYVDEGDQDVQDTIDAILGRADIRALLMDSGASLNPNTGAISREFITAPEADDGTDEPIRAIANRLRELQVFHLLTRGGYRYYLHVRPPSDNLNQLAVSYMLMYYLGSLTRYHPQHYREIFSDRQWLVRDFLETDPIQFTYGLASEIAGVDVVVPQSVRMNDIQIT